MKKNSIILMFFLIMTSFLIFSQTAEDKLLTKKEKVLLNYLYLSTHGNRIIKLQLLDKLSEGIDSKEFSSDDSQMVDIVVFLTQEGTSRKNFENNVLTNNYPDVRVKACKVLAKMKTETSRRALIEVIKNDENEVVLAEACISLGEIGDNANGDALRAIIYLYRSTYNPTQNLVFAIINSIKIAAKSTTRSYGDSISVLQEIMMGPYNQKIRESALEALQYLKDN